MKKGRVRVFFCLLILILLLKPSGAVASDPVFSQFFASPVYLNPAFSGAAHCSRVAMHYQQIQSIENYRNLNLSFDTFVPWLQGGIGAIITSDQADMYQSRHMIGMSYAYHLRVSRNTNIHFGIQAGYIRNDSRWSRFEFPDTESETPPEQFWSDGVDFSAGILAYNERWYAGFAAHHLNRPDMSLLRGGDARLPIKYTAHMGGWFENTGRGMGPAYVLSPNLILQSQGYHTHINAGLYAGVEPVMAGVWFRHWLNYPLEGNNSLIFLVSFKFDNYQLAYSYDHSLSGFSDLTAGVHELSLVLKFNCSRRNMRYHILNCPTF